MVVGVGHSHGCSSSAHEDQLQFFVSMMSMLLQCGYIHAVQIVIIIIIIISSHSVSHLHHKCGCGQGGALMHMKINCSDWCAPFTS